MDIASRRQRSLVHCSKETRKVRRRRMPFWVIPARLNFSTADWYFCLISVGLSPPRCQWGDSLVKSCVGLVWMLALSLDLLWPQNEEKEGNKKQPATAFEKGHFKNGRLCYSFLVEWVETDPAFLGVTRNIPTHFHPRIALASALSPESKLRVRPHSRKIVPSPVVNFGWF